MIRIFLILIFVNQCFSQWQKFNELEWVNEQIPDTSIHVIELSQEKFITWNSSNIKVWDSQTGVIIEDINLDAITTFHSVFKDSLIYLYRDSNLVIAHELSTQIFDTLFTDSITGKNWKFDLENRNLVHCHDKVYRVFDVRSQNFIYEDSLNHIDIGELGAYYTEGSKKMMIGNYPKLIFNVEVNINIGPESGSSAKIIEYDIQDSSYSIINGGNEYWVYNEINLVQTRSFYKNIDSHRDEVYYHYFEYGDDFEINQLISGFGGTHFHRFNNNIYHFNGSYIKNLKEQIQIKRLPNKPYIFDETAYGFIKDKLLLGYFHDNYKYSIGIFDPTYGYVFNETKADSFKYLKYLSKNNRILALRNDSLISIKLEFQSDSIKAFFEQSDTLIEQNSSVKFYSFINKDYESLIWDFGDGDLIRGEEIVEHVYSEYGEFDVSLMVFDGISWDTLRKDKCVKVLREIDPEISYKIESEYSPTYVTFWVNDPDPYLNYRWHDGTKTFEENNDSVRVLYDQAGRFSVYLEASDSIRSEEVFVFVYIPDKKIDEIPGIQSYRLNGIKNNFYYSMRQVNDDIFVLHRDCCMEYYDWTVDSTFNISFINLKRIVKNSISNYPIDHFLFGPRNYGLINWSDKLYLTADTKEVDFDNIYELDENSLNTVFDKINIPYGNLLYKKEEHSIGDSILMLSSLKINETNIIAFKDNDVFSRVLKNIDFRSSDSLISKGNNEYLYSVRSGSQLAVDKFTFSNNEIHHIDSLKNSMTEYIIDLTFFQDLPILMSEHSVYILDRNEIKEKRNFESYELKGIVIDKHPIIAAQKQDSLYLLFLDNDFNLFKEVLFESINGFIKEFRYDNGKVFLSGEITRNHSSLGQGIFVLEFNNPYDLTNIFEKNENIQTQIVDDGFLDISWVNNSNKVEIYDLLGNIILSENIVRDRIDIHHLKPGIYFLIQGPEIIKFIKQ